MAVVKIKDHQGNLFFSETYVNATKNACFGESGVIESDYQDVGEFYRRCVREFGRCIGKVHRDVKIDGKWEVIDCGWVFQKRMRYEDARPYDWRNGRPLYREKDYYIREVWVSLHARPPVKNVEQFVLAV